MIILVLLTNTESNNLTAFENAASNLVTPIQNGLIFLKNKVNGNNTFFTNINELKGENEELKKKNSELEQSLRELETIKTENESLKEYLNLTEKYSDYTTIPADIINRDISNYSKTVVINVGSNMGIAVGMTVIADQGLVGYVISVTDTTAKVQTIIDSSSAVTANLMNSGESIICRGSLEKRNAKSHIYPN